MLRIRKYLALVAILLVGAAVLGAPTRTEAAFSIKVFVDNVDQGVTTIGSDQHFRIAVDPITGAQAVNNFSINSINANTNWSGSQSGSRLGTSFNADFSTAFGPNGGTHQITIVISENGWLAPVGSPLILSQSAGGSVGNTDGSPPNQTLSVSSTAQGFLDTGNTLAITQTPGGGFTPVANAGASVVGTGSHALVYAPDPAISIVPGSVPFTMTTKYVFTVTTTGTNTGDFNVSGSLTAAVPVPAGLVLALTGLPTLGLGAWLRRRRQAV